MQVALQGLGVILTSLDDLDHADVQWLVHLAATEAEPNIVP